MADVSLTLSWLDPEIDKLLGAQPESSSGPSHVRAQREPLALSGSRVWLIGLRPPAASQAAVLAVASFERTSISGALGSCGWGIAARANSAIAPGRKTRQ